MAKGGDYLLALKANRLATHDEVVRFLADSPDPPVAATAEAHEAEAHEAETHETWDDDPVLLERRRYRVCHDVA